MHILQTSNLMFCSPVKEARRRQSRERTPAVGRRSSSSVCSRWPVQISAPCMLSSSKSSCVSADRKWHSRKWRQQPVGQSRRRREWNRSKWGDPAPGHPRTPHTQPSAGLPPGGPGRPCAVPLAWIKPERRARSELQEPSRSGSWLSFGWDKPQLRNDPPQWPWGRGRPRKQLRIAWRWQSGTCGIQTPIRAYQMHRTRSKGRRRRTSPGRRVPGCWWENWSCCVFSYCARWGRAGGGCQSTQPGPQQSREGWRWASG